MATLFLWVGGWVQYTDVFSRNFFEGKTVLFLIVGGQVASTCKQFFFIFSLISFFLSRDFSGGYFVFCTHTHGRKIYETSVLSIFGRAYAPKINTSPFLVYYSTDSINKNIFLFYADHLQLKFYFWVTRVKPVLLLCFLQWVEGH